MSAMPVFTIKAKDALALDAVAAYRDLCTMHGLHGQASEVQLALNEIELWQQDHEDEVHLPHHLHVPAGATDGRGELASFISANGATDRGTLSAPVVPADPTATSTRSVSVPLGGAS